MLKDPNTLTSWLRINNILVVHDGECGCAPISNELCNKISLVVHQGHYDCTTKNILVVQQEHPKIVVAKKERAKQTIYMLFVTKEFGI